MNFDPQGRCLSPFRAPDVECDEMSDPPLNTEALPLSALTNRLRAMAQELETHLRTQLLPFWLSMEDPLGGYWISVDARGGIRESAEKTLIFSARLAWTFLTAGRRYGDTGCNAGARRALDHLALFRDRRSGGFFASLDRSGAPINRSKHIYGQAFAIFALAAAARDGDETARIVALETYEVVEEHARGGWGGLYIESFDRDWNETQNDDRSLGEAAARHTADTHLHLIEAYLELFRATGDERVARSLQTLVASFLESFLNAQGRFTCQKITGDGANGGSTIWPGHDIEASWLLDAAADTINDEATAVRVRSRALELARGAISYGMLSTGAWRERVEDCPGAPSRILWWVQAEALLGLVTQSLRWGDTDMAERALRTWAFTRRFFLDPATGDWRLRVLESGEPDPVAPRIVHWKDPYHQARACMEIARRVRSESSNPAVRSPPIDSSRPPLTS